MSRQGRKGRSGQFQKLKKWDTDQQEDTVRILFHCSSVGEWLQAVPVIEKLKSHNSELLIIVSFFSASGYNYVKDHPMIDLKVYLPLDTPAQARMFFHILKPQLWIISKFDVWPNHLWAASGLNIPTIMLAATLSSTSRRYKGINKWFGRQVYKHFQYIFPIGDDHVLTSKVRQESVMVETPYAHAGQCRLRRDKVICGNRTMRRCGQITDRAARKREVVFVYRQLTVTRAQNVTDPGARRGHR